MIFLLTRKWWMLTLVGICAVLFGLLVLSWTKVSASALWTAFGIYCLIEGLLSLCVTQGARQGRNRLRRRIRLAGIFSIVIGLMALASPTSNMEGLYLLVAIWALGRGIFESAAALQLRVLVVNERVLLLSGFVSIAFNLILVGLLLIGVANLAAPIVGAFALLRGTLFIVMGLEFRSFRQLSGAYGKLRPYLT